MDEKDIKNLSGEDLEQVSGGLADKLADKLASPVFAIESNPQLASLLADALASNASDPPELAAKQLQRLAQDKLAVDCSEESLLAFVNLKRGLA